MQRIILQRSTITVKEAADYLGVCKDLVYRLAKEKQIPSFKLGGRVLFRVAALDKWMSQQESKALEALEHMEEEQDDTPKFYAIKGFKE